MIGIVEQLQSEASERAGSIEGFNKLIKLLFEEVENMDSTSPEFVEQYTRLIKSYILAKRQLNHIRRRIGYDDFSIKHFKDLIKQKREEARLYAASKISSDKLKSINKQIGSTAYSQIGIEIKIENNSHYYSYVEDKRYNRFYMGQFDQS